MSHREAIAAAAEWWNDGAALVRQALQAAESGQEPPAKVFRLLDLASRKVRESLSTVEDKIKGFDASKWAPWRAGENYVIQGGYCLETCCDLVLKDKLPVNWPAIEAWEAEVRGRLEGLAGDKPKRRRRATDAPVKPLTAKQAEAAQIVAECEGSISRAAKRLGKSPKTIRQHYQAGMKKLGKNAVKHATRRLSHDRRGQANIAEDDDRRR